MKRLGAVLVLLLLSAFASGDWKQWRGPLGTGVSEEADPPSSWSATENVKWKTELPGAGHSSPIVAGDRVFVTAAVPVGLPFPPKWSGRDGAHNNVPVTQAHEFRILCLDRATGKILWNRMLRRAVPHEGGHESGSLASASPVTDGKVVVAFFGSHGLYALDLDGKVLWEKDLGDMHSKHGHGEGASPVLHDGRVVVNWDEVGQSFVTAFDLKTGKELWRQDRDEPTSWATPIVIPGAQGSEVVINGTKRIRSYLLASGDLVWEHSGLSKNVVASPVYQDGILVAGSSYDTRRMVALRVEGALGDLEGSKRLIWEKDSRTPYVPSLLLYEESLYFLTHYQGVMSKVDYRTGEVVDGPYRLLGMREIYASPVAAADKVFVTDRTGSTLVLRHREGKKGEGLVVAKNEIGEEVNGSLALSGKQIFLRGAKHLFCIEAAE